MASRTFTSRWILPVAGPPLERGTITVRGEQIESVDSAGVRIADEDFGDAVIIPGLVNAHTHLDLTGAAGLTSPKAGSPGVPPVLGSPSVPPVGPEVHSRLQANRRDAGPTLDRRDAGPTLDRRDAGPTQEPSEPFPEWLKRVITYRRQCTAEQVNTDIQRGLAESLRYGVTLLGDIASGGASWPYLASAPLRAVVFWEIIGTTPERLMAAETNAIHGMMAQPNTPTCIWGRSPHAPYSVHKVGFNSFHPGPVAIHLAESQDEIELLAYRGMLAFEWCARFPGTTGIQKFETDEELKRDEHLRGAFVPFLKELGVWEPTGLIHQLSDVLHPRTDQRMLVIHGNYLPGDVYLNEFQSLVICPRTHAAFGHPPHPFREFLTRGVNVCVGTDSLASNPDLDLLAELRELHRRYPDVPSDTLLKMGTINGAKALGFDAVCGTLEAGKSADFVLLSGGVGDDPYESLFAATERRTMFRGEWR